MRRRAPAILTLAALCTLAFWLRTTNAASVFVGDGVVFAENDPYYHMRRVFQILAAFPRVPYVDPWIDPPRGAPVVFAPLFDFGIAAVAKLLGLGVTERLEVETLAAFVPPILGALTCLPVFWLAMQTTSLGAALLAATLTALVPAHIWYSRLGFVDHHVAVTFLYVTTCALVLRALGVGRSDVHGAEPPPRSGLFATLATLALAAGVLTWNGYLLLATILDVYLVLAFCTAAPERRQRIARLAAVLHVGAALLILPVVIGSTASGSAAMSVVTLSYLHVVLLASFGLVAAAAAWASAHGWPLRRLVVPLVAMAATALVALLAEGRQLAGALRWILASDPFMSSVQESVPIALTSDGRLDLEGPQIWMTRFFFAAPVLLALLAIDLVRKRFRDAGRSFVLVWATALFVLTLRQRRFGETFAPALAVLVADFLVALAAWVRQELAARGSGKRAAGGAAAAAIALLVLFAIAPYHAGFVATPEQLTAVLRAPLVALSVPDRFSEADRAEQAGSDDVRLHRALTRFGELRRASDAAGFDAEAEADPAAVMNPWPLGHKLLYAASVPVTATPFGSYVGGSAFDEATDFYLANDEARALELLARRESRWVVVDNDLGTIGAAIVARGENPRSYYGKSVGADGTTFHFLPPLIRTLYLRLTKLGGSEVRIRTADGASETVPALDHFRLALDSADDDAIGFPKAYEVVRGARLLVRTAPGAAVTLRYAYTSGAGRERVHEKTVTADAAGAARFVLPYSSERPDLGQTSSWIVEGVGRTRQARVAEADVREGRELVLALD